MFDSFEGLSKPETADTPEDINAYLWNEGDLAVSLEDVQSNLAQFDFVRYYKGWIPDRFQEVADQSFALVHIDVDLYQPTRDSLEFFYPRMLPGGMIVCDDYGSTICPGAKKAFDNYFEDRPEKPIHLTTGQGLIIRGNFAPAPAPPVTQTTTATQTSVRDV